MAGTGRQGWRAPRAAPAAGQGGVETLEVFDFGGLGDGVARRADGEVVLVPGGVPGDVVDVTIHRCAGGVRRATIGAWRLRSPHRVAPACPVADRCGGCPWLGVDRESQRASKERRVAHAVAAMPLAPGHDGVIAAFGAVPALGWRRRVRLHLRRGPGGVAIGLLARGSDALVALQACPQLEPRLSARLARWRTLAAPWLERGELHGVAGVDGVVLALDARAVDAAAGQAALAPAALAAWLDDAVVGVELVTNVGRAAMGAATVTLRDGGLADDGDAPALLASARGFAQASQAGNRAIREALRHALDALRAQRGRPFAVGVEAYAGAGNLTPLLAAYAGQVTTFEADADACARARMALQAALPEVTMLQGDAATWRPPGGDEALWLLDPGRPGAAALCAYAVEARPAAVALVSCEPSTLRRDLHTLAGGGYLRTAAAWVDTMPGTPHAEAIVVARRGGAG